MTDKAAIDRQKIRQMIEEALRRRYGQVRRDYGAGVAERLLGMVEKQKTERR